MQTLLQSTTAYRLLKNEAAQGKLSHTYLLLFPDEYNLRAALKVFAPLFFSECSSVSERIERENHPDCLFYPSVGKVLDRDGALAILEESNLGTVESPRKLFVLDNFHKANAVVQNKLLKVLEEPPAGVCFLLGATSEFPILTTVKSRAKRLEIPPFSEEQVAACLERSAKISCSDATAAAAICDGCVGKAQNLLAGGRYRELQQKAFDCVSARGGKIVTAARALNGVSEKFEIVSLMKGMYRDMLFFLTGQSDGTAHALRPELKALANTFTPTRLVYALDRLDEAEKQLTFNANLSQCVEVCLLKTETGGLTENYAESSGS